MLSSRLRVPEGCGTPGLWSGTMAMADAAYTAWDLLLGVLGAWSALALV